MEIQTLGDLPQDKRELIERIERYVSLQYQIIMMEGGSEVAEKLAGLFSARETLIQQALKGELT